MQLQLSLPPLPAPTHSNPNHACSRVRTPRTRPGISIKLALTSNNNRSLPAGDFIRQISISPVLVVCLGLGSLWAFPSSAAARISSSSPPSLVQPQESFDKDDVAKSEDLEKFEDKDMESAFERWKSKSYALTVPLRVVALEGSVPPVWIKEFLRSQGKRVRFRPEFRRSLGDIFQELSNPFRKGKINPNKSVVSADLITLGDSWLNFAIGKGLIEPIEGAEEQNWFRDISDKWKVYLRRDTDGNLDSQGRVWAVPYRWGSMVIAYNQREFRKHKLAPVEDWSDLWRPELSGKISMVDSPREIIGTVLKYMGASYNIADIDSQVFGGKQAVRHHLQSLLQQVRLFDSQHYLKAFKSGDVWVAVGWSSDVLPVAKTMSNVSVIVPKSGASLWADFWAIPTTSRLDTHQFGGRVRGSSPLSQQWVDFCLQPERVVPFTEEIIAGASPVSLGASLVEDSRGCSTNKGRPKMDTNLVANMPPPEILSRCELLEPLSENALSDYQWLMSSLQKPNESVVDRLTRALSSVVTSLWSRVQFKSTA